MSNSNPPKKKMDGNPDANLLSVGNYNFGKTLGEGNFAKVKLAKHKLTGQEVKKAYRTLIDNVHFLLGRHKNNRQDLLG